MTASYTTSRDTIFMAALRHDRIDAPWVVDGPINGAAFLSYVKTQLVPALTRGDIVILDNPGSHKGQAVRAALRGAGAKLFFLPAYSPQQTFLALPTNVCSNPIEQVFSKLKHQLRKAAERTVDATWSKIGVLPECFSSRECMNYLTHCGYGSE